MGNKSSRTAVNIIKSLEPTLTPAIVGSGIYNDFTEKSDLIIPNNTYYNNEKLRILPNNSTVPIETAIPIETSKTPVTPETPVTPPKELPPPTEYSLNNTTIFIIVPSVIIGFVAIYYFYTTYTHQTSFEN